MAFLAPLLGEGLTAVEGAGAAAGGAAAVEGEGASSSLLSKLSTANGNKQRNSSNSTPPTITPLNESQISSAVSRSKNFEIGRQS